MKTSVRVDAAPVMVTIDENNAKVVVEEQRIFVKVGAGLLIQNNGGGDGSIRVPFGYGDATPKIISQESGLVSRASIVILQPFNAGATLKLGDVAMLDRLIPSNYIDVSVAGEYEVYPLHRYVAATDILLSIQLIGAVSQGAGIVVLEID